MRYIICLNIFCITHLAFANQCQKPEVNASAYVTEDATILTHVAFTTQFTLKCINGLKGISLYAEVDGIVLPAVRLSIDNKYQVSWIADIKKIRSGDYNIKLYDEESYSAIRRAIRNNEDRNNIMPLAVVVITNTGIYRGPYFNSELLASLLTLLISYGAFSAKSKLLT